MVKLSKKSPGIIWKLPGKVLIFAPASREKHRSKATKTGSEKFWKKFQNLLEIRKNDLPLHPLRIRNTVRNDKKKGSENFWKNLSKRFGGFKKMTYLCTTFRSERALETFEVFFWKRFGKSEKRFYLCNRFPLRKMKQRRTRKVLTIKIERRSLKILSS